MTTTSRTGSSRRRGDASTQDDATGQVRRDRAAQVVGFLLLTVSPLIALLGQRTEFANMALACAVASVVLVAITAVQMRVPILQWLLTPVGTMVGFMALAFGLVPQLWTLGLATPWTELGGQEQRAAGAGLLMFAAFCIGVWLAAPRLASQPDAPHTSNTGLTAFLVAGLLTGVLGYLVLAAMAGGPVALLYSLAYRRESLAGTGPIRSLILVSAVACIAGMSHTDKTRNQQRLTVICGVAYVGLTLLTGSRFQALIVAIAAFAAHVRIHGATRRATRTAMLALLVVVPASTYYGLRVRTGLTYGIDVQVVDRSSPTAAIASLIDPFVRGGIDSLRTLSVVTEAPPALALNYMPILGSVTNIVPRSLWPSKPEGSASVFSARYFPDRWADGTGVPPSISAELVDAFGLVGGVLAIAVVGFLVARLTSRLYASTSVMSIVVLAFLTADCLQLVKGGSDGFMRSVVLQLMALLVAMFLARLFGLGSFSAAGTGRYQPHPWRARSERKYRVAPSKEDDARAAAPRRVRHPSFDR